MKYRLLGKTGLRVSVLGLGASPLGGSARLADDAHGAGVVRLALDLGINFFDVAPSKGLTMAEEILARALRGIPRDRYHLATKVGRYGTDVFDYSARRVTQSVDESLRTLGVDHIDIIQASDIEFAVLEMIIEETLPALQRLKERGKARFIGVTGLPMKVFRYVIENAEIDTVHSYCRFTLLDESLMRLIPTLEQKGIGVINAAPLAMGLLSDHGPPGAHRADPEVKKACARAAELCRSRGTTLAKVAMQFAVSDARIGTTLVGTANPEHLRRNVEWIQEAADDRLLEDMRYVLTPVHGRTWTSGRAENND